MVEWSLAFRQDYPIPRRLDKTGSSTMNCTPPRTHYGAVEPYSVPNDRTLTALRSHAVPNQHAIMTTANKKMARFVTVPYPLHIMNTIVPFADHRSRRMDHNTEHLQSRLCSLIQDNEAPKNCLRLRECPVE